MAASTAKKPAPARKKAAPRTTGTPKAPPKPRKVTAAAKPKRATPAPRRREATGTTRPQDEARAREALASAPTSTPPPVTWEPVPDPVPAPAPQWVEVPGPATLTPASTFAPASTSVRPAPAFDPATGDWLPVGSPVPTATAVGDQPAGVPGHEPDPAAYRKGAVRSILLNVVLALTLGLLVIDFVFQVIAGAILYFAPDSGAADQVRDLLDGKLTPQVIIVNSLLTFVMMGVVPFLWVLGTRVRPWAGTRRYLHLDLRLKDVLRGIVLVPMMLIAVFAFVAAYTCAVDGCGALAEQAEQPDECPPADLLCSLTWPVVITVALCAGIGEEILFRGLLRKSIGLWGQAIAFGLAHAVNAYPPQVIFAAGMGVLFGYLMKRGWSIVSLMVAHFLYDFVLLSFALLAST